MDGPVLGPGSRYPMNDGHLKRVRCGTDRGMKHGAECLDFVPCTGPAIHVARSAPNESPRQAG